MDNIDFEKKEYFFLLFGLMKSNFIVLKSLKVIFIYWGEHKKELSFLGACYWLNFIYGILYIIFGITI